jgi:ABC-type enterobactin transport system permease subunit
MVRLRALLGGWLVPAVAVFLARVVRCFIEAICLHIYGPVAGAWGSCANEFSLCDSSLEQCLTLLTQLVKHSTSKK